MTKCKCWKKYKGIRPPICLGGKGCDKCYNKYRQRNNKNDISDEAIR